MISCSLILKMKLVPPSLPRSSYVSSSFLFILQCLVWQSVCVHPLYKLWPLFLVLFYFLYYVLCSSFLPNTLILFFRQKSTKRNASKIANTETHFLCSLHQQKHVDVRHIFLFIWHVLCNFNFIQIQRDIKASQKNIFQVVDKNILPIISPYLSSDISALFRVKRKAARSPLQRKEGRKGLLCVCFLVCVSPFLVLVPL